MHFSLGRLSRAIFVFIATVSPPLAAHAQDCELVTYGEVPITRSAEGNVRLGGILDDKPIEVGIDFDRPFNLISRAEADKRDVRIKVGMQLVTPGEDSLNDVAAFGSLRLAAADLHPFEAFIDERRKSVEGIVIGTNVLKNFLPEFDIAHDVIRLFARPHCDDKLVYWSTEYLKVSYEEIGGRFVIKAKIDGKDAHVALAPGLPRSIVDNEAVETMSLQRRDGDSAKLDTLEFGGVKLRNLAVDTGSLLPELRFSHGGKTHLSPRRTIEATDLKIGDDVLKHLRFIIDFQAKTIYFTVG